MKTIVTFRTLVSMPLLLLVVALGIAATESLCYAGLVLNYTFDDGTGATATDSASTANGTLTNMNNSDWVAGKIGSNSLEFTGSNSEYVTTAALSTIPALGSFGSGSFTVSAWINTTSGGDIAATGDAGSGSSTNRGFELRASGLSVRNAGVDGSTTSTSFGSSNLTGSWIHVVAVRDTTSGELRVYQNGSASGTPTAYSGATDLSNNGSGARLTVAAFKKPSDTPGLNGFYTGRIDDVALWDEVLTTTEIAAIHNLGNEPALNYNASESQLLFDVFEGAAPFATIGTRTWRAITNGSLSGSDGDVLLLPGNLYAVNLGSGNGVVEIFVPEPATLGLLGIGVGLIVCGRRRRSRPSHTTHAA